MPHDPTTSGLGQRALFGLLTVVVPAVVVYEVVYWQWAPTQVDPVALISGVVVVLVYWATGALLLWRRFEQQATRRVFFLCQALALALLPMARPWPPPADWVSALGMFGFHMAAPSLLHYAVTYPVQLGSPRWRRWSLSLVYGLSLLSAAGGLTSVVLSNLWVAPLAYTGAVFAAAISVLCIVNFRHVTPGDRRPAVMALGSVLAIAPANFLYFIPRLSGTDWWMPEWLTGLFLLLAPLSFLYALARHRPYSVDRVLNRTLVYVLLSLGILALYAGPFLLVYRYLPTDPGAQMVVATGLTLLVGLGFDRTRTQVQHWVDRLFYGGWYDYPAVVETVSDALARSLKRTQLEDTLTRRVPEMMQLHPGELWIGEPDATSYPKVDAPQLQFPLSFEGQVRGVWTVGARLDGDDFTPTDRRILQTLAHQAEIALSNVLLVETLRRRLEEIREAQHQLLRSREEERARLARDLHDGPIQALVSLNLQLGLLLSSSAEGAPLAGELAAMRTEVRNLLAELRQVCAELRPPMLDTLGLGAAIRALVEEWLVQNDTAVRLELPPDAALRPLPGEVAVNLYRIVQEALTNIARHAAASQVALRLTWESPHLTLTIQDDGQGFVVPAALQSLTGQGHFGLAGMKERVDLIGGTWSLESYPDQGTIARVAWQMPD